MFCYFIDSFFDYESGRMILYNVTLGYGSKYHVGKGTLDMNKDQCYIGAPNGVVLCVDKYAHSSRVEGRLYHGYQRTAKNVVSLEEMILYMETFFDQIHFPFPGTQERSFKIDDKQNIQKERKQKERMIKVMKDSELLEKHGEEGTFIIRVQHRQHSSWQGLITWVDENKTIPFRSALELIKLIDGALDDGELTETKQSF